MVCAVLLLEISPLLRELTTKKVIPADSQLLLEEALVAFWVEGWVDWLVTEKMEEAFVQDVQ